MQVLCSSAAWRRVEFVEASGGIYGLAMRGNSETGVDATHSVAHLRALERPLAAKFVGSFELKGECIFVDPLKGTCDCLPPVIC